MAPLSDEKDDGPECETCGKTTCPDAALPGFSEPRECAYEPIYRSLKDAKDCDYGCARDYTNQAVRLWVVEAVERLVAERVSAALADITEEEIEAVDHAMGEHMYGHQISNNVNGMSCSPRCRMQSLGMFIDRHVMKPRRTPLRPAADGGES